MLSNSYLLAKFCFDTAENEPAKNLQNICKNPAAEIGTLRTADDQSATPAAAAPAARKKTLKEKKPKKKLSMKAVGRVTIMGKKISPLGRKTAKSAAKVAPYSRLCFF